MASKEESDLSKFNLVPVISERMEDLFQWLDHNNLIQSSESYQVSEFDDPIQYGSNSNKNSSMVLAAPTQRTKKLSQDDIKELKKKYKNKGPFSFSSNIDPENLWHTLKNKNNIVRTLRFDRLPADAMAFYRPFHLPPFNQWGVYLLLKPLLEYHSRLTKIISKINCFTPEILMHLTLFEIFHHEFFHHIAESTATTIEIIYAALEKPKAIYLDYRKKLTTGEAKYPHNPLEEALANAYAWNSLGFISRVKAGYKTTAVSVYQKAIEKHWEFEPDGYKAAKFYIRSGYIHGGAHLLAQMMGKDTACDSPPLMKLAQSVMPSGFSAYVSKPDIPTWLVGSPEELELFHELVPAPNEAYTQLSWPYDTSKLDIFIQAKKDEEKKGQGK